MKTKNQSNDLPQVSVSDIQTKLRKKEAILLRLTVQDKATITLAAQSLHLTATEFLTKSALLIASKISKTS